MPYAIHITHRDEERPNQVIGPFATREEATTALNASDGWERDDRGFDCWHHADDWPYVAVVVPVEPASSLREKDA